MHNLYSLILFLSLFGISFANAQNDSSRVSVVRYYLQIACLLMLFRLRVDKKTS